MTSGRGSGFLSKSFHFLFDDRLKPLEGSLSQHPSVDEDRGCSPDPRLGPVQFVFANPRHDFRGLAVLFKRLRIQAQLPGDFVDLRITEIAVVAEEPVVELPEFALSSSGKRCDRRRLRIPVVSQRIILERNSHRFRIFLEQLLE